MPAVEKVEKFIHDHDLLEPGDGLLLAVSAGKDSMAMVHIASLLKEKLNLRLGLFHLNHQLRGRDAELDEEFVKDIGKTLEIPVYTRSHDFSLINSQRSFEEEAREVRYSLADEIARAEGFTFIATAHNLDDNVETILMRSFEGTGLMGLGGIPRKRGNIIRPLLSLSVGEILAFLEKNNISWREDQTNRENLYQRNYLRNNIIPLIEERFPRYRDALTGLGTLAREHLQLLDELTDSSFPGIFSFENERGLLFPEAIEENTRLFRYLIIRMFQRMPRVYGGTAIVEEILKNYFNEGSHRTLYESSVITVKKTLLKGKKVLVFVPREENPGKPKEEWSYAGTISSERESTMVISETGLTLSLFLAEKSLFMNKKENRNYIFVTIDKPEISFIIRNRRTGDRIILPFGTKKIKEIFIEKKLDNEVKNCVPLLITDNKVSAIMSGFSADTNNCIADSSMVTEESRYILAVKRL